jgi:hypothetical protein
MMDNIAGSAIIPAASRCDFNFVKSVSGFEMNLAKNKAVNILHSSAGCKLKPPAMGIQLFEPFTFFPKTIGTKI